MAAKFVALIFASLLIQDAVSSERAPNDIPRAHDGRVSAKNSLKDGGAATVDHQNSGKIWNWNFGNDFPANREGKFETPFENDFPTNDRALPTFDTRPSARLPNDKVAHDENVSPSPPPPSGFQKSYPKNNRDSQFVDARYSVPNRNLVKLKNQLNNNNDYKASNNNKKYESEEYDFDDESDDDDSFDSQSGSSQSYDDYDDDDFSRENKYPKRRAFSPNRRMGDQRYATSVPGNKRSSALTAGASPYSLPATNEPIPTEQQPAMQTRSLQMRNLRAGQNRYESVGM